jgi:hypothetical protein
MRHSSLLAFIALACASCDDSTTSPAPRPSPTTSSFRVISTSQPSGGTISLPATWPQNARVLAPTVTIEFTYGQSIQAASVVVDLMMGPNVCLEAEGLQPGPGYATVAPYIGGSTITITGNNFERNMSYPLCSATSFTTDHLRFRLMAHNPPASPGGSLRVEAVATADVPLTWTFSK